MAPDDSSGKVSMRPVWLARNRLDDMTNSRAPRAGDDVASPANSNVPRLAIAQALAGGNAAVVYATGAIVGSMLAPDPALATLPISIFVVGMAICTLPAGVIARRHGRRAVFMVGTTCGVLVGLLSALAVVLGWFWLFCVATFFGGAYNAVILTFRFAAADSVPADRQPRALSAVMAGGVFAGILGPQLVTYTMNLWFPYLFAATFIAQAAVAAVSAFVLSGVRVPKQTAAQIAGGRPLRVIARQPRFIAAVICGVVSYTLMNFIMTSAPLAMRLCGLPQESSNLGIQWHIVAMYAPSFFTGRLITRFGAPLVIVVGLFLTAAAAAIGLQGLDVAHFWATLVVVGVGWNFGFLGASALVLECHRPEERTTVQSFNDFLVFGTMTIGSFTSGTLLISSGWNAVLWVTFLPVAVAIAVLGVTTSFRRRPVLG